MISINSIREKFIGVHHPNPISSGVMGGRGGGWTSNQIFKKGVLTGPLIFHWKIWPLGVGGLRRTNIEGELLIKEGGAWAVCWFKEGLTRKTGVVFWLVFLSGSFISQCTLRSSFSFNHLPTKKFNHKKNQAYPNLVNSICHRVDLHRLAKLLTSILFLLLFQVSYPPSMITLTQ